MEGILKSLLLHLNPYQRQNLYLFLLGLLKARTPLISRISSKLPLKTKRAFYTTRRMWRFLSSLSFPSTEIQDFVLSSILKDFNSPIFFDFSGVEKRRKNFEGKGRFFDFKEGRWKEGFPFLLPSTRLRGRAVPLSVKLMSPHSMERKGSGTLSLPLIISIMRRFPKAIAVMDKEFSVGRAIREFSLLQVPFILPARRGVILLTEEGKEVKVGEMEGRKDFYALHRPSGVWLRVLVREDGFTLLTNLHKEKESSSSTKRGECGGGDKADEGGDGNWGFQGEEVGEDKEALSALFALPPFALLRDGEEGGEGVLEGGEWEIGLIPLHFGHFEV